MKGLCTLRSSKVIARYGKQGNLSKKPTNRAREKNLPQSLKQVITRVVETKKAVSTCLIVNQLAIRKLFLSF